MNAWIQLVGWALVHALWQITLLVMLAALVGLVMRSQARHRFNAICLLLCLALPVITAWRMHSPVRMAAVPTTSAGVVEAMDATSWATASPVTVPLLTRLRATVQPHFPVVVAVWAVGVLAMALRLGGGYVVCLSWKRKGQAAPPEWQARLDALAKRMGIARRVRLLLTGRGDTPLAMGLWKPAVLVPASLLTQLPPTYLEALLAHELAHVHRLDYLSNLLQGVAETLLFFHPAVWWLSARIRAEREQLSDDLAAQCLGEPRRLALALNALDDLQPSLPRSLFPALAARGGTLLARIQRLLAPPQNNARRSWGMFSLLMIPCIVLVLKATTPEQPFIFVEPILVAELDAMAMKEGLDPHLVRSVAWVESEFNRAAKSPRGAMGVMQVMPETARRFGAQDLTDRVQVMATGAKYLRFLLDRYNGNVPKAVTAYNSGETALDQGKVTEESVRYQATVLEVLKAKAVQPEPPLQEGEVMGVFRRRGDSNQWTITMRLSQQVGFNMTFLPVPDGEGKVGKPYGELRMGSTDSGKPAGWSESRPKVLIEFPENTSLMIRCTDSQGLVGEYPITLSSDWHTFRLNMKKPTP